MKSEAMDKIEALANDVRGLAALLVATNVALAYERLRELSDLPDQPVTLGTAEGWLDHGVDIIFQNLDRKAGEIQDLAFKVKG
jgi:hypothetical protein